MPRNESLSSKHVLAVWRAIRQRRYTRKARTHHRRLQATQHAREIAR